jgi:hypothetical protein
MALNSGMAREMNARARGQAVKTGGGSVDLFNVAKDGVKDAATIKVAQEALDVVANQLSARVTQLEGLPRWAQRALVALGLNWLFTNYGDRLPLPDQLADGMDAVCGKLATAAFLPLFDELDLQNMLDSLTSALSPLAKPAAKPAE